MLLINSCITCYLSRKLYFFLFLEHYVTASRQFCFFVYVLVALIVVVNAFSYILIMVCHFDLISFIVLPNNKRKLPANNQNLEKSTLRTIAQVTLNNSCSFFFYIKTSVEKINFLRAVSNNQG